ncbi:putative F420-dependent oxidoreductase [Haloactinopolyspora alba]|uniref:Putative F420-dependent oxidoreductase n=1 Tax=Haloactinopolyspora alba TaxID=648780 RepID=A0A2P8E2D2_9ACTN|nr:TIGR03621 family F420-dependent LLM class oxidoreductase [Haloactinopolyspora alba]PSL03626.1 putative F420-dependent oxidoreductase [Haloactinopolyspora alba]
MLPEKPFRFGVNLRSVHSGQAWAATCREAEQLGYDVVLVPDHLGGPAPFPALAAAAGATTRARLGTFVLNAAFWNPALLAREVATLDQISGGRFELGLGTGYVRDEFETAGLPWESPGARVDRLAAAVRDVDTRLRDPEHQPRPAQDPRPPLLLGGHGDRMLRLAAEHADVVAFTGATLADDAPSGTLRLVSAETLDDRVAHFRAAAGARAADVEANILVQQVIVTDDRRAVMDAARRDFGLDYLDTDQLLELPTLLVGTVEEIAGQVRAARERFGFSYVTVLEPSMRAMAPVVKMLAGT